jgi:hypothetical protein
LLQFGIANPTAHDCLDIKYLTVITDRYVFFASNREIGPDYAILSNNKGFYKQNEANPRYQVNRQTQRRKSWARKSELKQDVPILWAWQNAGENVGTW